MKRRKRRLPFLLPAVALTLLLSQGLMGVNYSAWLDDTSVASAVTSGGFAAIFAEDDGNAFVVNRQKPERALRLPVEVDCELSRERNTLTMDISGDSLTEALLEPDRFLAIYYPIETTEDSSVSNPAPRPADLQGEPDETIEMEDEQPVLYIGETPYVLPGAMESLSRSIYLEVYHSVIVEEDRTLGVLYLSLSEESREHLAEPKALTVDAFEVTPELLNMLTLTDDGTSGILEGEIRTQYRCELPLYLEQGREEAKTE